MWFDTFNTTWLNAVQAVLNEEESDKNIIPCWYAEYYTCVHIMVKIHHLNINQCNVKHIDIQQISILITECIEVLIQFHML